MILNDPFEENVSAPILNNIEDVFVDGSNFGMDYGKYCYLSVF